MVLLSGSQSGWWAYKAQDCDNINMSLWSRFYLWMILSFCFAKLNICLLENSGKLLTQRKQFKVGANNKLQLNWGHYASSQNWDCD